MPKRMSPFGIYSDRPTVSDAIDVLRGAGYRIAGTSVVLHQSEDTRAFEYEMGRRAPGEAAMGAAVGAAVGAVLAWLCATGKLPPGGLRPFVDAGAAMAAFAGAGGGGAIGWVIGFFAQQRVRTAVRRPVGAPARKR
jgi:hypothetical protein